MKSLWGQRRLRCFIISKSSSSVQVLDLSNSWLVHSLPLSTRRMSKHNCDAPGMFARPWFPPPHLPSVKSEYHSTDGLDILCAGCPCLTCSLRLFHET